MTKNDYDYKLMRYVAKRPNIALDMMARKFKRVRSLETRMERLRNCGLIDEAAEMLDNGYCAYQQTYSANKETYIALEDVDMFHISTVIEQWRVNCWIPLFVSVFFNALIFLVKWLVPIAARLLATLST